MNATKCVSKPDKLLGYAAMQDFDLMLQLHFQYKCCKSSAVVESLKSFFLVFSMAKRSVIVC